MVNDERCADQASENAEGHRIIRADVTAGEDDVAGHGQTFVDPQHLDRVDTAFEEDVVAGHLHSGAIRPDVYGDAGRTP